jgi:hypothetical protein
MAKTSTKFSFDADLLPVQQLTAGSLTCLYENGNLRYIKWAGEEIIRMIYPAVRDHDWATATYEITDEVVNKEADCFSIRYTAHYSLNDIRYKATIRIEATVDQLSATMEGVAQSSFLRNRIGFCVHHPVPPCAGKSVQITHPDGSQTTAFFPREISPHQPFLKMAEMVWQTATGATIKVQFEGDVFETEDQRNWTDHSFKTYSTPLAVPYPVLVNGGDTVFQKITITVQGSQEQNNLAPMAAVEEIERLPFPFIGYERVPGLTPLTAEELALLQEVIFDHYRVVLHLSTERWAEELTQAAAEAALLHVPIELVVFLSSNLNADIATLSKNLQRISQQVGSVLLLQEDKKVTPPELMITTYPVLKSQLPQVKIGFGTDGFFAELNRNRPATDLPFDFISYSVNPQVHATDTRTLMENLQAQGDTVSLVQSFAPGKEVFVSPVTFKIRNQEGAPSAADADIRMYTSFGAMWTLLSIQQLAAADRITFYQTTGYRGVLANGGRQPLFELLKQMKSFATKWIIRDKREPYVVRLENEKGEERMFSFDRLPMMEN